jgi:hypothetical protein
MTSERQPATDPPPQWLLEVMELVERRFQEADAAPSSAGTPSPPAPKRLWERVQRMWAAMVWDAWDGQG